MPLDPLLASRLHLLRGMTSWQAAGEDPALRARLAAFAAVPDGYQRPEPDVHDREVAGPNGPVRIRIYRPAAGARATSGLVWCHGGGFVAGGLDDPEADALARELTARTGAVVVSVDYRLAAPGVTFPIPHDDVHAAWSWVTRHTDELGIDPERLSLGGGSAGANLAAGVAVRLRDEGRPAPALTVLVYPLVHTRIPAAADHAWAAQMDALPALLRFTADEVAAMVEAYVGAGLAAAAYAMPAGAKLAGLGSTLVVTSEFDDLRPSGEAYAAALAAAAVQVEIVQVDGAVHGHLQHAGTQLFLRTVDLLARAVDDPQVPVGVTHLPLTHAARADARVS